MRFLSTDCIPIRRWPQHNGSHVNVTFPLDDVLLDVNLRRRNAVIALAVGGEPGHSGRQSGVQFFHSTKSANGAAGCVPGDLAERLHFRCATLHLATYSSELV